MADHHDLGFKAEYAKSGRAACKGCKNNIGQDTLRLAVMVQVWRKWPDLLLETRAMAIINELKPPLAGDS